SSPKLFHTSDLSGPKLSHLCWSPTVIDTPLVHFPSALDISRRCKATAAEERSEQTRFFFRMVKAP
ncbi:MAG: hypothetical protein QGI50_15940, partial [Dehalococcoidia bacterium]|nr:hypothetical protein [Dehalococcoidia bacterium]